MSKIKTITATTTEQTITFDATYQFVWFRSLGDGDVLVSDHSGIVAGTDDVALVKGGDSTRITVPYNKTVYVKAVSDSVDMEIHAQNFSDAPFEGGSGGGGGSITIDPTPTQGSSNAVSSGGVYTALQGVSPINYSTTEQNTGRKWIDGKSIYQKTFVPTAPATYWEGTNNSVDVSGLNIDTLINIEAQAQNKTNSNYYPLPMISTPLNTIVMTPTQSDMLIYLGDNNIPTRVFSFTIWYTKTTNTAE